MPDDYILDIHINKDEEKRLQEFGLNKDRFITIQRGVNPFSGTIEAPKMWPVEHFNTLIKLLKIVIRELKLYSWANLQNAVKRYTALMLI